MERFSLRFPQKGWTTRHSTKKNVHTLLKNIALHKHLRRDLLTNPSQYTSIRVNKCFHRRDDRVKILVSAGPTFPFLEHRRNGYANREQDAVESSVTQRVTAAADPSKSGVSRIKERKKERRLTNTRKERERDRKIDRVITE